jgi:formylmethanofuran dehydrogenase subunit B
MSKENLPAADLFSVILPTVRFTTAVYGVHRPGTAYPPHQVPIPLRAFLPRGYPSDGNVLRMIGKKWG